ncbi:hypothetical protein NUW58_g1647 [Xylaria curta]|uniref:Uncharacterized protein n=1 Tax=Xylaria curta TaxID=42375 RepID=A0ACC1PLC2_9PEZI|nr:hypothetical protein NUW58_g1647 [Xylaria curta]
MDFRRIMPITKFWAYLLITSQFALVLSAVLPDGNSHPKIAPREEQGVTQNGDLKAFSMQCPGYAFPQVICISRCGSLIHGDFERKVRDVVGDSDTYESTSAPSEPTFQDISYADFLVWDTSVGFEILGPQPSVEFIFAVDNASHVGPVYAPTTNELYFSRLSLGFLPQLVIDLNQNPPTLSERVANPPIYAGTGGRFYKGLIYFSTIGGNSSLEGHSFRPGVYTLDPRTGKSNVIVNNYYGYYFNGVDDLEIDDHGQIWFTDNNYGRTSHVNTHAPQMGVGTYRFNTSSGLVSLVEDSLLEPNGIIFSPDFQTLYLSDTGAGSVVIDDRVVPAPPLAYNSTGARTTYAYDVSNSRKRLLNKRVLYRAIEYVADGIGISREGYLVAGTGHGVDILSADGEPLVRVQTNFTVLNTAWAGKESDELWAFGKGGIARIRLALKGPKPE